MTFRINASFEADGSRRADLECEPASDEEIKAARTVFLQVLRLLEPLERSLSVDATRREAALAHLTEETERLGLYDAGTAAALD